MVVSIQGDEVIQHLPSDLITLRREHQMKGTGMQWDPVELQALCWSVFCHHVIIIPQPPVEGSQ